MNNIIAERKAVYDTASICTRFNWIFREQSIVDYGIDALVETTFQSNPSGKLIAFQIKGGDNNFHRSDKALILYFSDRHYYYWQSVAEKFPLIIVLQDASTDIIYWQVFSNETIEKTTKQWKITVPLLNKLNSPDSKIKIEELVNGQGSKELHSQAKYSFNLNPLRNPDIIFDYYLDYRNKLCCDVLTSMHSTTIEFNYSPAKKDWDKNTWKLKFEDPYYFTLDDLEKFIREKYISGLAKNSTNPLKAIRQQIKRFIAKGGMDSIAEKFFDIENAKIGIPRYKQFIQAFEYHTKLERKDYQVKAVGQILIFRTKQGQFQMDTYQGKTVELKSFIEEKSYDEIYTMTNVHIWNEIYVDAGIPKEEFIPVMHNEWEEYWESLYNRIQKEVGHTNHLDRSKERSLRQLQSFMAVYGDSGNIIQLAYDFDEMVLYPIAVLTMMDIFNADVCYDEYCEWEFENGDWESICVDDENFDAPIFYLSPSEF